MFATSKSLYRCAVSLILFLCGHCFAQNPSATYTHNVLDLSIPYFANHAGSGKLQVQILNPEGEVLARVDRTVSTTNGNGVWRQELPLAKTMTPDELIWQRVRYRFTYAGDATPAFADTRSISAILRRPVMRGLGQTNYLAGAAAALRVVVTDDSDAPELPHDFTAKSTVHFELFVPDKKPLPLFIGHLDHRGTTQAEFHFPAGLTGDYTLHVVAETPLGPAEFKQAVHLEDKVSILLTTEKPLYQPSQTIHVRALALNRADHHAVSAQQITFEVEDPLGNKVFRKAATTDAFGIASAEFHLADEVNLGAYHLLALMGKPEAPSNTADLTLRVERYVLPKFHVAVAFTIKSGKPQCDFRPGNHVTGVIHANYFFGKPVDDSTIDVKLSGADVTVFEAAKSEGRTDTEGAYHFDLTLPSYFSGRAMN